MTNNKIVESQSFAFVSSGTRQGKLHKTDKIKKSLPKSDGNFTSVTTLGFLIRRLSEASKQNKIREDGSASILLNTLEVDPNLKSDENGLKKRFKYYGMTVDQKTEHIFVNSTITGSTIAKVRLALFNLVQSLDGNLQDIKFMTRSPQYKAAIEQAQSFYIPFVGNYQDSSSLEDYSDETKSQTLYLNYIQLLTDSRSVLLSSFDNEDMDIKINGQDRKVFPLSDSGKNDGSIVLVSTLKFLADFGTNKYPKVHNTWIVKTKDGKSFISSSIGRIDYQEMSPMLKAQIPESIQQTLDHNNVKWINFEMTYPSNTYSEQPNGKRRPRKGSTLEKINIMGHFIRNNNKINDRKVLVTGALSFNPKNIRMYTNKNNEVNATFNVRRTSSFIFETIK